MFLFGARRFGRMGPLGLAYTGYQLWRRLSPQQKQALKSRATQFGLSMRRRSSGLRPPRTNGPGGIGESAVRDQVSTAASGSPEDTETT
jgi:hypothetical protein